MSDEAFPKGILPVLPVADIDKTVEYFVNSLKFQEVFRQNGEDGTAINAQVTFEGSTLMLNLNPEDAGKSGGGVYFWVRLYDTDIDEFYAGLKREDVQIVEEIADQFWGDRSFVINDCNGFFIAFNQEIRK